MQQLTAKSSSNFSKSSPGNRVWIKLEGSKSGNEIGRGKGNGTEISGCGPKMYAMDYGQKRVTCL